MTASDRVESTGSTGVGLLERELGSQGEALGGRGDPVAAAALGHEAGAVGREQHFGRRWRRRRGRSPRRWRRSSDARSSGPPGAPARRPACAPPPSVSGSRKANSSPPYRKTRSVSRAGARTSPDAILRSRSSPAWWPRLLLTSRKSSRSSMIRLNLLPSRTARAEPLLERRVVEQAGQAVGPGADLDRLEHLGVLERDRDLRGEQLDELELVVREGVARPEPLDREHADRAAAVAQRDHDQAAVVRLVVVAMVDPRVVGLVADVDGLVVLHDPGRDPGLAGLPGSM